MVAQPISRDNEIKAIHEKYKTFYQILGRTFLVGLGIFIGLIWFSSDVDRTAYIVNLFTTFLGTLATVLIIDYLNRQRDDQRKEEDLKAQLVRDAGSSSNEIAKNAIHQLERHNWLRRNNGLLQGADLFNANLQQSNLESANLQGAFLLNANLQGADLFNANLQQSNLRSANLQGANLFSANLQQSNLYRANLQGTNLRRVNLSEAFLRYTHPNETTILPDGSHWTPDTDLNRFTDPTHPQFWRSSHSTSPAYRKDTDSQ